MFGKKKQMTDTTETLNMQGNSVPPEPADRMHGSDRKGKKKKLPGWAIFPILGAVVLLVIVVVLLIPKGGKKTAFLKTMEVKKTSIADTYSTTGTIESEHTKTYYSPVTAPIETLNAKLGQTVKAGDVLVSYNVAELERANQQAQLTLNSSLATSRSAKAKNAQAIEAASSADAQAAEQVNKLADKVNELAEQVNAARDVYESNAAEAGKQIAAAEAQRSQLQQKIEEYKATIAEKEQTIRSIDTGYAGGRTTLDELRAIPQTDRTTEQSTLLNTLTDVFARYDEAMRVKDQTQALLDDAQNALSSMSTPTVDDGGYAQLMEAYEAAYAQWEAAYNQADGAVATPGMTQDELNALDASDNLAELAALSPQELLAKGREGIKADMNGVIASLEAVDGSTAAQGAPLFTIAGTDQLCVRIELSPDDVNKAKAGTKAQVKFGDATYEATLSQIDRIATKNAKGNPVVRAAVHITSPDEKLTVGANAKVSMILAQADQVIAIPNEVINASTDGDFVYVIEKGIVEKRMIKTGLVTSTMTEVTEGLREDDQLVNDPSADITPGMKATAQSGK